MTTLKDRKSKILVYHLENGELTLSNDRNKILKLIYDKWKEIWLSTIFATLIFGIVLMIFSYYFLPHIYTLLIGSGGGIGIVISMILLFFHSKFLELVKPIPNISIDSITYNRKEVIFATQSIESIKHAIQYTIQPPSVSIRLHNKSKYVAGKSAKIKNCFIEDKFSHATIKLPYFKEEIFNISPSGYHNCLYKVKKLQEGNNYVLYMDIVVENHNLEPTKEFKIGAKK